jgi:hypothetical protein
MKIRSTIKKLIAITMAVAAIAVIGSSWMAGRAGAAGRSDTNDIYVSRTLIGIIPVERIRVSVGTSANPSTTGWFRYQTTNPSGVPLYESEWIEVPPGEFRFSDVLYRDLNTEGEPVTGRKQVMATVTLRAPAGSNPDDYFGSLEVVNTRTGSSYVIYPYKYGNAETCTVAYR